MSKVTLTRPTGVAGFDEQVVDHIRKKWVYAPANDGKTACAPFETVFLVPIDVDAR